MVGFSKFNILRRIHSFYLKLSGDFPSLINVSNRYVEIVRQILTIFSNFEYLNIDFEIDFSPSGIQEIVDSTISSLHGRYQLLRYISELQLSACAYSSKINYLTIENEQNEINLLRVRFILFKYLNLFRFFSVKMNIFVNIYQNWKKVKCHQILI